MWIRYFVWNFKGTLWNSTQNILPIHWKMRFLYNIEILRALRFKSSYAFLKRPPGMLFDSFLIPMKTCCYNTGNKRAFCQEKFSLGHHVIYFCAKIWVIQNVWCRKHLQLYNITLHYFWWSSSGVMKHIQHCAKRKCGTNIYIYI